MAEAGVLPAASSVGGWDFGGWDILPEGFEFLALLPAALALGSALIGAVWVYMRDEDAPQPRSFRGMLRYLFPKEVIWHPSARLDYAWAVLHRLTYPFLIAPAIAVAWALGHVAANVADKVIGPEQHMGSNWVAAFAFTMLATVLARDFAIFFWHRMEHRLWFLWEFHKVHHAAEAMVYGITARRNHPVNEFLQTFIGAVLVGAVSGVFARIWNADVDVIVWLGIDVFYFCELLGMRHLKHSHINLRFPRWLEYILVSPGQHQVHHSQAEKHWDKNFSTLFAFWDVMFGTWLPSEPKPVTIGLQDGESAEYRSLWAMYTLPFRKCWRQLRRRAPAVPVVAPAPIIAEERLPTA
jgi:sterol desaturase/sphingolipid hydroxylase (fatty acid hydroxylase superfamily)